MKKLLILLTSIGLSSTAMMNVVSCSFGSSNKDGDSSSNLDLQNLLSKFGNNVDDSNTYVYFNDISEGNTSQICNQLISKISDCLKINSSEINSNNIETTPVNGFYIFKISNNKALYVDGNYYSGSLSIKTNLMDDSNNNNDNDDDDSNTIQNISTLLDSSKNQFDLSDKSITTLDGLISAIKTETISSKIIPGLKSTMFDNMSIIIPNNNIESKFAEIVINNPIEIGGIQYLGSFNITYKLGANEKTDISTIFTDGNSIGGIKVDDSINAKSILDKINDKYSLSGNNKLTTSNTEVFIDETNKEAVILIKDSNKVFTGQMIVKYSIKEDLSTLINSSETDFGNFDPASDSSIKQSILAKFKEITNLDISNEVDITLNDTKTIATISAKDSSELYYGSVNIKFTEKQSISDLITVTDLGDIDDDLISTIISAINDKNDTDFSKVDLSISINANKNGATISANSSSTKYKGEVEITFTINGDSSETQLPDLITVLDLGEISDTTDECVKNAIIEQNDDCPSDIYFLDNSLKGDAWKTNASKTGQATVYSHEYKGTVTVTYTITHVAGSAHSSMTAIDTWSEANVSRDTNTTTKTSYNNGTYYSAFADYGGWQYNDFSELISGGSAGTTVTHGTLAFFTEKTTNDGVCVGGDTQFLSLSDAATGGTWSHMLKTNFIDPLYKANGNSCKGIKLSYGGASSNHQVWDAAIAKETTDEARVEYIKNELVETSKLIGQIAGAQENDYPKDIDFDIESGTDVGNSQGVGYLIEAMAELEAEDSEWTFSITPAALPGEGMTSQTTYMLDDIALDFSNLNIDLKDYPAINPMCMDYGAGYSGNKETSEFELARKTVLAVKDQYKTRIAKYVPGVEDSDMWGIMAATPMSGINDTVSEVYTLEDAKELYNWANDIGLRFIGNWSLNDDFSTSPAGNGTDKSYNSHGLSYLNDRDFARAFNGDWTEEVKKPKTKN